MSDEALFQDYNCPEDYIKDGVLFLDPMLAKEIETEEDQDKALSSPNYFIEEKFDGTRATLHFFSDCVRCFSRRVSVKTNWFCENSDSVPHIRDYVVPELAGTVIDGEMFIPNRPFKDVSSTLNCTWDKAVERQKTLGKIVFHAFDILYYKGIKLENMPLYRRKEYLKDVISELNSPYVVEVVYQKCGSKVDTSSYESTHGTLDTVFKRLDTSGKSASYPNFSEEVSTHDTLNHVGLHSLSPRAFYEYLVASDGEGVIVKPITGKYLHKRGWEYSKIKKFLTREVVIMGFNPPTSEYKGKFPTIEKWDYWETNEHDVVDLSEFSAKDREQFKQNWYPDMCAPVSKFYAKGWVGTIRYGVIITPEEIEKLPKSKTFNIETLILGDNENPQICNVIEVGECAGFDEEQRAEFSELQHRWLTQVIEVKANEIFKDTGKLRHPRFLRMRYDKSNLECTWKDHVS